MSNTRHESGANDAPTGKRLDRRGFLGRFGGGVALAATMDFSRALAQPSAMPAGVTVLAEGLSMPEGPIALDDGAVLVCEILEGRLTRIAPDGSKRVVAQTGGGPNGAALGPGGACFITNNGGYPSKVVNGKRVTVPADPSAPRRNGSIQRVDLASGQVTTLYEGAGERRFLAPNDLVFDADGGFWFTDLGGFSPRSLDYGSLYWARADGSECREVDRGLITPNGVALSPDRRTLYVASTEKRQVIAYAVTGPGKVATRPNGMPQRRVLASLGGDIGLDSMAVEEGGNLVVGTLMQGALTVLSPAGDLVERLSFPGWVTNVAFGGRDRKTAYATMTPDGKLVRLAWPRPGLKLAWR